MAAIQERGYIHMRLKNIFNIGEEGLPEKELIVRRI